MQCERKVKPLSGRHHESYSVVRRLFVAGERSKRVEESAKVCECCLEGASTCGQANAERVVLPQAASDKLLMGSLTRHKRMGWRTARCKLDHL